MHGKVRILNTEFIMKSIFCNLFTKDTECMKIILKIVFKKKY